MQRIQQVIFNLLSNAIKFSETGSIVNLELKVIEDEVQETQI